MLIVTVASLNPVKIQAALNGFGRMFPGETFEARGVSVPSGVRHQPLTDDETLQGALNRAANARVHDPQADFWVGIEGGCEAKQGELAVFAWIAVCSREQWGKARTAVFFLPPAVAHLVQQGVELGEADDLLFKRTNSKQGNGAVGLLTHDVIDRLHYYEHAVVLALVPFKNQALYAEGSPARRRRDAC